MDFGESLSLRVSTAVPMAPYRRGGTSGVLILSAVLCLIAQRATAFTFTLDREECFVEHLPAHEYIMINFVVSAYGAWAEHPNEVKLTVQTLSSVLHPPFLCPGSDLSDLAPAVCPHSIAAPLSTCGSMPISGLMCAFLPGMGPQWSREGACAWEVAGGEDIQLGA